jgi:hypothetical protein
MGTMGDATMKKRIFLCGLLSLCFVLVRTPHALAFNLVTNPGFESWYSSGLPQGWNVVTDDTSRVKVDWDRDASGNVNLSGHSFNIGSNIFGFDTLSQTVFTVPGVTYNFSFWVYVIHDPNELDPNTEGENLPNYLPELKTYWDGGLVSDIFETGDWVQLSFRKEATTTNTLISFSGRNGLGATLLDNIFVDGHSLIAVPEPTTALFFILSLGAVAGLMRRGK